MLPMKPTSKCAVLKQLYSCFLNDAQQFFFIKKGEISLLIQCPNKMFVNVI